MGLHAFRTLPFWLAAAAWPWLTGSTCCSRPAIPAAIARVLRPLIVVMENKSLDWFNENVLARAARGIGVGLWKGGDTLLIDGVLIDGSAKGVGMLARAMRFIRSHPGLCADHDPRRLRAAELEALAPCSSSRSCACCSEAQNN